MSIPYLQHALDNHILCVRQMLIMELFRKEPKIWFHDIAKSTRSSKPAVSRALDALSAHRFLEREWEPLDRRRVAAVLTDQGRKFLEKVKSA